MLSVRLLVSSRLLVAKFLGSPKLHMDVQLGRGSVVPLIPASFKGQLCKGEYCSGDYRNGKE